MTADMFNRRVAAAILAAAAVLAVNCKNRPAVAEGTWPSRAVTFIVASAPGGATDLYARLMADFLTKSLKQTFVVENRPGGSGNAGAGAVARAAPDGYTFLVAGTQSLVINPSLFKNLPFDAEKDLTPVARGVISPMVLVSHPSLPAHTLRELMDLGKSEPNSVPFGSAGYGSTTYFGVRLLEEMSNVEFVHVPFKGLGQAFQTLLSGDIKFIYDDVGTALPMIQSGRHSSVGSDRSDQSAREHTDRCPSGISGLGGDWNLQRSRTSRDAVRDHSPAKRRAERSDARSRGRRQAERPLSDPRFRHARELRRRASRRAREVVEVHSAQRDFRRQRLPLRQGFGA